MKKDLAISLDKRGPSGWPARSWSCCDGRSTRTKVQSPRTKVVRCFDVPRIDLAPWSLDFGLPGPKRLRLFDQRHELAAIAAGVEAATYHRQLLDAVERDCATVLRMSERHAKG